MKYQKTCAALIKQINDGLERQANSLLRNDGLTVMQAAVLIELDQAESKTFKFKDLEHRFGVAQSTMFGVIQRLARKDLVKILESPEDKREKLVRLTKEGERKCNSSYTHMEEAENSMVKALDEEERKEFRKMLLKIKASLQ